MQIRLYENRATDDDYQNCLNLIQAAPSENAKRPFLLLASQYRRLVLDEPESSLATCAPYLIGKERAKIWKKANDEAIKVAKDRWVKDCEAAKKSKQDPPKAPVNYFVELPPLKEWTIDNSTALFAIEVVYSLAALERPQEAIKIIDVVGQQFEDETRVLASECGADLFLQTRLYKRSIEFYGFALKTLNSLKKREYVHEKGERIFFTAEQTIIKNRLESKLEIAQRLLDEKQFGPDWVSYRDSQRLHFDGKHIEAYFAYLDVIKQFPESVYAAASACYSIEMLTQFADENKPHGQAKLSKEWQDDLQATRQLHNYAKRSKTSESLLASYQSKIERLEQNLELLKKLPLGQAAIEMAERETEKFIERDKFGLYRGEAMLDCGACWLEIFLDPDKAEPWLKRANDWFYEVQKTDSALSKLQVPDKSQKISAPPPKERFKDQWTNILPSKLKPGNLFNRRECGWYLDSKVKEAVLWLGFIAFARNDLEEAKTQWTRIAEIDKEYNRTIMETRGSGTASTRLLYFLETKPGLLHATREELLAFNKNKRRRFAVLLADCAYVAEKRDLSEKTFRRLDRGELGELSKNEKAYIAYGIFSCLCWKSGVNETEFLEKRWSILEGSVSEKRAVMGMANRMNKASVHYGNVNKRLELREQLIAKFPSGRSSVSQYFRHAGDCL